MKILILQNELSAYNVATYNEISKHFDLTLGFYNKDKSKIICTFEKIKLEAKHFGPFIFIKNMYSIAKQFDLICFVPDMHVYSYCILPFLPHNYKVVNWSIGFRVSYVHPYLVDRKHVFADKVFQKILDKCDSTIFYMEKAKEFWKGTSFDLNRVFVAPNTTEVAPIDFVPEKKKNFLFIGTLYKGKGLDLLLDAFKKAKEITKKNAKLVIIGDGEMRECIEQFIEQNSLLDSIELRGPIYDEHLLAKELQNALLCISPTQGGLSCPKSMGYGVPFVCRKDAITGGEIYHTTNGVNGIHYNIDKDLVDILVDAINNPQKYVEMGRKAKSYYDNNATVFHMAQGVIDAFNFALNKK